MINPKFSKFIEDNPNITMLGLSWSLYWRIFLVVFSTAFIIGVVSEL